MIGLLAVALTTPSVVRPPAFFSERGRRRLVTGGATLSASAKSVLMKLMGFPAHDAEDDTVTIV